MTLDEAWAACEAALPEGWWLDRLQLERTNISFVNGGRERYEWWEAWAEGPKRDDANGTGSTPAVALQDLAQKFRG